MRELVEVNELVSVIVPIYNVEDTLERCIDSILQQTYMNIEIILVNDSSPDDSETICQKYKSEHPNIIKYFKKENEGLGLTRNYGMKRANGILSLLMMYSHMSQVLRIAMHSLLQE